MTSPTPPESDDNEPTVPVASDDPGYGRANQAPADPPPGWSPPPPGWSPPPPGYGAPAGQAPYYYGFDPAAPYGVHPRTGVPYSDKQKLVAGLLQMLVPIGIGRMYIGDVGIGIAQLVVTLATCGIGALWSFVDGILMLTGEPNDANGRPLRG